MRLKGPAVSDDHPIAKHGNAFRKEIDRLVTISWCSAANFESAPECPIEGSEERHPSREA
jgi:hypothetical protein